MVFGWFSWVSGIRNASPPHQKKGRGVVVNGRGVIVNGHGIKKIGGGFPSFRGLDGGFEGFWRQIWLQHVKISQGSSFESIPLDWRRFHKGRNYQKVFF